MKILLILPKIYPRKELDYNYTFPLGICYISAVLKEAGYDVKCFNLNHTQGHPEQALRKELEENFYDIVATGSIWMGFIVVKEIIKITRMYSPKSKIIVGGNIISTKPELAMKELLPDYGIIGEGEETILELVNAIKFGVEEIHKIKGICFITNKEVIINDKRIVTKDLDSLPYPDFEGFDFKKYLDMMYTNQMYQNNILNYPRTYSILTGRGCQFNCTFCYHPEVGYRERKIDEVIKEIRWAIQKYNVNVINIIDDTFSIKRERVIDFCKKIKKFDLFWCCQMNVAYVDEELLSIMKNAGCFAISYGFESYSPEVLKSMKKPITPEQIDFAIKTSMKLGISIQGNFIFGDPAETKESIQTTLDYWKKNCKGQIRIGFLQPYVGSELYNYCMKKGMILNEVGYMGEGIWDENSINMTEKITNEEYNILISELKELKGSGYVGHVFPKEIFRLIGIKDRYAIKVDCPYCKKENVYENYYFKISNWYKDMMICRECGMRYNICKPI